MRRSAIRPKPPPSSLATWLAGSFMRPGPSIHKPIGSLVEPDHVAIHFHAARRHLRRLAADRHARVGFAGPHDLQRIAANVQRNVARQRRLNFDEVNLPVDGKVFHGRCRIALREELHANPLAIDFVALGRGGLRAACLRTAKRGHETVLRSVRRRDGSEWGIGVVRTVVQCVDRSIVGNIVWSIDGAAGRRRHGDGLRHRRRAVHDAPRRGGRRRLLKPGFQSTAASHELRRIDPHLTDREHAVRLDLRFRAGAAAGAGCDLSAGGGSKSQR